MSLVSTLDFLDGFEEEDAKYRTNGVFRRRAGIPVSRFSSEFFFFWISALEFWKEMNTKSEEKLYFFVLNEHIK